MKTLNSSVGEVVLLYDKNEPVLAGKSRRVHSGGAWGMGCVGLFMMVWLTGWLSGSGFFAYSSWQDYQRTEQNKVLNVEGVITQGTVVERSMKSGEDIDYYYITYRFYIDRTAYTAKDEVSFGVYNDANPETRVMVRHLPDNPKVSRYVASESSPLGTTHDLTSYGVAGLFNCIGLAVLLGSLTVVYALILRTLKFRRFGRVVGGKITRLEPQTDSDGDPSGVKIHYQFEGRSLIGAYDVPQSYKHLTDLAVGMPLAIWYADDKTHQPL